MFERKKTKKKKKEREDKNKNMFFGKNFLIKICENSKIIFLFWLWNIWDGSIWQVGAGLMKNQKIKNSKKCLKMPKFPKCLFCEYVKA